MFPLGVSFDHSVRIVDSSPEETINPGGLCARIAGSFTHSSQAQANKSILLAPGFI
jgi:hypothetical protein